MIEVEQVFEHARIRVACRKMRVVAEEALLDQRQ
jgi:hypothetical protein